MVKGLDPGTFRDLVSRMVQQRAAIQNVYEVVGAVEFEYTFWAKPDNESAVRQNLIDVSMLCCVAPLTCTIGPAYFVSSYILGG